MAFQQRNPSANLLCILKTMEPDQTQCPVCHGARTRIAQDEERRCGFCRGTGTIDRELSIYLCSWIQKRKRQLKK